MPRRICNGKVTYTHTSSLAWLTMENRWERLEERGLRPAWTEPNLLAVTMNVNGDKDPNMAEYTLINVHDKRSVLLQ